MIIWCNECYGGGQPIPCDNGSLDEHRSLRHHGKPYLPEEPHLPPEYDDDEDEEDWVEITGSMVRGRQVEPERPGATGGEADRRSEAIHAARAPAT